MPGGGGGPAEGFGARLTGSPVPPGEKASACVSLPGPLGACWLSSGRAEQKQASTQNAPSLLFPPSSPSIKSVSLTPSLRVAPSGLRDTR